MLKSKKIIFLVIVVAVLSLFTCCSRKPPEVGVFYTTGRWDIPPAFHGNPWAPGGQGNFESYIYEPLFVYLPRKGEFIDRLGKSFEVSPDGMTLTVHLKKNVQWHDNTPFTSRDVQTTFRIGYLKHLAVWHNLESIECPDDYTVVFHWYRISPLNNLRILTQPITSSYKNFGEWSALIPDFKKQRDKVRKGDVEALKAQEVSERKVREVLFRHRPRMPVGTGPFKLTRVTASDMILDRFEGHYERENVKIKKMRIQRGDSNEVIWSYLMGGEIDGFSPACTYDVAQQIIKRNPGTRLITPSDLSDFGIIFNCRKKPMSNLAFRRAVAHLVDRDAIRKVAFYYGRTVPDYSLGIPDTLREEWVAPAILDSMTRYDYNREKAAKLLTDAGYSQDPSSGRWLNPGGEPIQLEIIAPAGLTDLILLGEAATAQLNNFNIPAQVRVVALDIYSSKVRKGDFDMAVENGSRLGKYGHPSIALDRFYGKQGMIHVASGLEENQLDQLGQKVNTGLLARELRNTMDEDRRREIVQKLVWITNENLPYLTCYEKNITIFVLDGKRVTGWPPDDDKMWEAGPTGIETIFCTLIVKGRIRPAVIKQKAGQNGSEKMAGR